jgi:hypothetical protein
VTQADVREAEALEADALAYPEEREEILLEAAVAWQRAGRSDRARAVLGELVGQGGEYACDARVQLADLHMTAGEAELAGSELAVLAKDPALADRHCELAAELLAAHDDLTEAARWYDRAAARVSEEELETLRRGGGGGWLSIGTTIMLRNRQHVRAQLGLDPDILDTLVPDPATRAAELPTTSEDVFNVLDRGVVPAQTRLLTFQRDQRRLARQRWPSEYMQTDDEYYAAAEHRWREIGDGGVPTITVVPGDVEALVAFAEQHNGSPTDPAIKRRYCQTAPAAATMPWPPERNSPCWCGSARKYKKCCGKPG